MRTALALGLTGAAALTMVTAPAADAHPTAANGSRQSAQSARSGDPAHPRACPPSARVLGYSDALNKVTYHGTKLGELSSLAWDRRSHAWVAVSDDTPTVWFFRNLAHPHVVRDPLLLRRADGTPFTSDNTDDEGGAVLPDGDFVVSSETEPAIRIFGRDGRQKGSLPVPGRFAVSPKGEATDNATLEGLTISPSAHQIVASMEGALSGDVNGTDANAHRLLVYRKNRRGHSRGHWYLAKQIGYRTQTGNRIPEVAAVSDDRLVVEEAAYSATAGNSEELYSVSGIDRARNVSGVANLGKSPGRDIVRKKLVANLVKCPTLGAPAKETQANPLLDNYEGMAITFRGRHHVVGISLISDDNFSATQTTRVLNLVARLPRH